MSKYSDAEHGSTHRKGDLLGSTDEVANRCSVCIRATVDGQCKERRLTREQGLSRKTSITDVFVSEEPVGRSVNFIGPGLWNTACLPELRLVVKLGGALDGVDDSGSSELKGRVRAVRT